MSVTGRILLWSALGCSAMPLSAAPPATDSLAQTTQGSASITQEVAAPPLYGPAPKAVAPTTPSKDGKVRKEERRRKATNSGNCLSKSVSVVGRPLIPIFTSGENRTTDVQVTPRQGLSACDAMLASPVDASDPWDRRAVFLQARAAHLVALGAYDVALEALDEADAIGATRNDPLFNGGVGVGNAMLRSFILGQQGKRVEALSEINRGRALRPHAMVIGRNFDRIEQHINNSIDQMLDTGVSRVKWQPDLMRWLLPLYIWRGNMEGASRIVDDVSTVNPKPIGGWTISGMQSAGKQLSDDIEIQMQRAYVWAALGDAEKSASIIKAVQADINEYVGPKPVAEQGRKVSKREMREYDARVAEGNAIALNIGRWQGAMELRAEAAVRPAEELFDRVDQLDLAGMAAGLDVLRQMRFANPKEQQQVKALLRTLDSDISGKILKLNGRDLQDMLPDPEYLESVPRFGGAGDGILFERENGFSQAKEKGTDIRTIRFGTTSGSGAMAEELALLAAAQYARKEGKDSFILLARRSVKRSTTVSGYYTVGYTYDSGYESQLRLVLLDSANLPAEWAGKRHRLIMADDILSAIKPRYDELEKRKAAEKAKTR